MPPKKKKTPAPVKGKASAGAGSSSASGKKKKKAESSSEEEDDDDDDSEEEEESDEDEVRRTCVHISRYEHKAFRIQTSRPRYTCELRGIGSGRPISVLFFLFFFSRGVKEI